MTIVVGFPLRWPIPVWQRNHRLRVPGISSIMVSFEDLRKRPITYQACVRIGIGHHFSVPGQVFLDNGAFRLSRLGAPPDIRAYVSFVRMAAPHWYPVPFDYMPLRSLSQRAQMNRTKRTLDLNMTYAPLGYVPIVHAGPFIEEHFRRLRDRVPLPRLAIGGLVPYLRHLDGADRYDVVEALGSIGRLYRGELHVFGIGGLVSLYFAALLGASSVDSSGWQIRAVNGVILLPFDAGQISARTRHRASFSRRVRDALRRCSCPGCEAYGYECLFEDGRDGFVHRSVHNLSILVQEQRLIESHTGAGELRKWTMERFRNSPYLALVGSAVNAI